MILTKGHVQLKNENIRNILCLTNKKITFTNGNKKIKSRAAPRNYRTDFSYYFPYSYLWANSYLSLNYTLWQKYKLQNSSLSGLTSTF